MSGYELLDMDERPFAVCDRCGRQTWAPSLVSTEDRMPQPDGNPCGGWFVRFES